MSVKEIRKLLERASNEEAVIQENQFQTNDSNSSVVLRCFSDIESKPIHWLWKGFFARGKVSMIAGHPGLGKSQITAYMAAIVSTGGDWPIDDLKCDQGKVIFLSAEDDAGDTIKPRLEAVGADTSKIFILEAINKSDKSQRLFNLKTDLEHLSIILEEHKDVALIVIDPISAYLGATDSHKNAEVRSLLTPLSKLAEKYDVAIVCVSHLNKGNNGNAEALTRVTGSLAFVAAARAAYGVVADPDNKNRRYFLPLKNNLGKDQMGLAFSIQPYHLSNDIETSKIVWEQEAFEKNIDEIMSAQCRSEDNNALTEAKEFLYDLLISGPKPAKEVEKEAEEAGHAIRTIQRAKDALGIKPKKIGYKNSSWVWALPLKMSKEIEDVQEKKVDIFDKVGHLHQTETEIPESVIETEKLISRLNIIKQTKLNG